MYNYKDTVDHSGGASALPAEALQINGIYIEEVISGYRTLSVSGRESLSAELNTERYGKRDGAAMLSRSYPERHITVQYQLMCESPEAFREAYNVLAGILDTQDAQLIFNDEPDKYFIGTPAAFGEVETGKDSVTGTFELICTDPHKYALTEKTVYVPEHTMLPGELTTSSCDVSVSSFNGGNRPVHPTIELRFHDEYDVEPDTGNQGKTRQIENSGNVTGITCMTNGAQLKFGNIDAVFEPQTFNNAPAPVASGSSWDGVSTSDRDNYRRNTLAVNGHIVTGALNKITYNGDQYFGVEYYGSTERSGVYGPTLSFGTVESNCFNAQCELLFEMTQRPLQAPESNNERGQFYFGVLGDGTNGDLVEIASVTIDKDSTGKTARWTARAGANVKTGTFEMNDKYFTTDTDDTVKTEQYIHRASYVKGKKSDNLIQIKRGDGTPTVICVCGREIVFYNPSIVQASQVLFMFGAEKTYRIGPSSYLQTHKKLAHMALKRWKFDMLNSGRVSEMNQFTTGDILRVDTENSDFTVDGGRIVSYGDIENDYENFLLNPGLFDLTITSFFAMPSLQNVTPKIYLKFREKWI